MTADKLAELKSNVLSFPFKIRHYREALKGISYILLSGHFLCICDEGQCQFTEHFINILKERTLQKGHFIIMVLRKGIGLYNRYHLIFISMRLKLGCTSTNIPNLYEKNTESQ